jgi:hypothetical protein
LRKNGGRRDIRFPLNAPLTVKREDELMVIFVIRGCPVGISYDGRIGICIKKDSMLEKIMPSRLLIYWLLSFCLLPISYSYGFEAKGQECSKCHTLSRDEAKDLLKNIIPDVAILEIRLSPVKGVWEVDLESRGRKAIVYVDFSKKHFFSGALVSVGERKNLTQERLIELNKVDVSQIPLEHALVMGDPRARIRVIVFTDPD